MTTTLPTVPTTVPTTHTDRRAARPAMQDDPNDLAGKDNPQPEDVQSRLQAQASDAPDDLVGKDNPHPEDVQSCFAHASTEKPDDLAGKDNPEPEDVQLSSHKPFLPPPTEEEGLRGKENPQPEDVEARVETSAPAMDARKTAAPTMSTEDPDTLAGKDNPAPEDVQQRLTASADPREAAAKENPEPEDIQARAARAAMTGGLQATPEETRRFAGTLASDDPTTAFGKDNPEPEDIQSNHAPPMPSRVTTGLLSLLAFALLLATTAPKPIPCTGDEAHTHHEEVTHHAAHAHHVGHAHHTTASHATTSLVQHDHERMHQASIMDPLAALVSWFAGLLKSKDICLDCNLPPNDGCKCVCYSGGYDPKDPACQ